MSKETYHSEDNLPAEYIQAKSKLQRLKTAGVRLLGFDYDLTIFDGKDARFGHQQAVELGFKIQQAGLNFVIVSSRSAALHRIFRDITAQMFQHSQATPLTCFLSGGNGMNLSEVTFDRQGTTTKTIYEQVMEDKDISTVIEAYLNLGVQYPDQEAMEIFHNFLYHTDWQELVSPDLLERARRYKDTVFIENGKVSVLLPAQAAERNIYLESLKNALQPQGLNVVCNDEPFVHVSRKMGIDGKLTAAQRVMERLGITDQQAGFFGDNPKGNDRGILSLPYGFTNSKRFTKPSLEHPPYILETIDSPVGAVYEAVDFLIQ